MTKADQRLYIGIGAAAIGLYAIYKIFGKSREEKEVEKIDRKPTQDGSTTAMQGDIPFTDVMANSVANTLHDYMRYCGTDEDGILNLLSQGYNGKALQKIYKAFGLKEAGVIFGCHGDTYPFPGKKKDLGTYLNAELSGEPALDAIRTIFRKANITF